MKLTFFTLAVLLSLNLSARADSPVAPVANEALFNALNAPSLELPTAFPLSAEEKSVGHLDCRHVTNEQDHSEKYSCSLSTQAFDAEAVYNALNVPESNQTMPGARTFVKTVDGLSCTKQTVVYPGAQAKFFCTLVF